MTIRKTIAVALLLGAGIAFAPAHAQTSDSAAAVKQITAADLEGLRAELRSSKKQVTAATLTLTDAEATKFWPIYDQYAAELTRINDDYYALIAEYVNNFGKYDDAGAAKFIKGWIDIDVRKNQLRAKYVPIVGRVLPGVKQTTFFQIDRRLNMLFDLKLASEMPVLQAQGVR